MAMKEEAETAGIDDSWEVGEITTLCSNERGLQGWLHRRR
jgi:hypothetical protein